MKIQNECKTDERLLFSNPHCQSISMDSLEDTRSAFIKITENKFKLKMASCSQIKFWNRKYLCGLVKD